MTRVAVLDRELCKPKKCNYECINVCPVNRQEKVCIRMLHDDRRMTPGMTTKSSVNISSTGFAEEKKPAINEDVCIGCGLCRRKCPFTAWHIVNLPEALKENPIMQFGVNGFRLFRLPIPVKGVVGLLGPNGVGKTTALRILSGQIKPNLGIAASNDAHKEEIYKELAKIHRGTEMQDYFEKLSGNALTISYKPQQLDTGEGIADLPEELITNLELRNCIGKKANELSGGELQRMSIAKAIAKEADIYYFDEPSSYLDVRQRVNIAREIRRLAENKFVMVVEHDLATLDIMADRIHIFYGSPSVYGVVSKPYVVRNGINTFLDGYIKEDNVRIREPVNFSFSSQRKLSKDILLTFDNIEKHYRDFTLHVSGGPIYEGEILGILGANALGKTTFAKILAGLTDYTGSISRKIKISYKPQYIDAKEDITVRELIEAIASIDNDMKILLHQLDVEKLMEKSVKNLSGGELQRIAISLCLSRKADLYLLDEPSAFLDVDQRLAVAKLLKSRSIDASGVKQGGSVAVIDHDLLFLSYLADRAMLFTGVSGKQGTAEILHVKEGLNKFLKEVDITFRRDEDTKRPRANKPDSLKDREQKDCGEWWSG